MSKHTNPYCEQPSAAPRLVIAGVGLVTPLGYGAWPTFRKLLAGKTIADRIDDLPDGIGAVDLVRAVGGVSTAQHTAGDPAIDLAERAAREACAMAGVKPGGLPLWLGSSKGAVSRLSEQMELARPIDTACAQTLALGPHGYLSEELATRLGTAPRAHHVAACASALVALDAARRTMLHRWDNQPCDHALVATAEAALTPAFVHSYLRLGVLSEPTRQAYRQYPLDQRRRGFMLAQAGAALLLRRLPPGQVPAAGEIELADTAVACEANHLIHTPRKMRALTHLATRFAQNNEIDTIHPHAPGTPDHDPRELKTLLEAGQDAAGGAHRSGPGVYACKGALGHTLGAAGLVSAVVSWMCLRTGKLPPMPWLTKPIENAGLPNATANAQAGVCDRSGTHAVFAAGFGGHTAGVLLRGHGPSVRA